MSGQAKVQVAPEGPVKRTRIRHVFGRVRVKLGGGTVEMRMSKERIVVRAMRSRKLHFLPLARVAYYVMTNGLRE